MAVLRVASEGAAAGGEEGPVEMGEDAFGALSLLYCASGGEQQGVEWLVVPNACKAEGVRLCVVEGRGEWPEQSELRAAGVTCYSVREEAAASFIASSTSSSSSFSTTTLISTSSAP